MDHPEGASETGDVRLGFDRWVRLELHGSKKSSDGGLLLLRELDEVLGLHDSAGGFLRDTRTDHNRLHSLVCLLRLPVLGPLAGYEDMNDADRLALDPVMRQVVGGWAVDGNAASTSQMERFETEALATTDNRAALADMSGQWINRVHQRRPPEWITLNMDNSVTPTYGTQESTAWNGHFGCMCYHPLFVFNQFGHPLPGSACLYAREGRTLCSTPGQRPQCRWMESGSKGSYRAICRPELDAFISGGCRLRHPGAIQNAGSGSILLGHPPPGQSRSSGLDCAFSQAPGGLPAKRREAFLQRLCVSGGVPGYTPHCHRQSRVASRRVVPT